MFGGAFISCSRAVTWTAGSHGKFAGRWAAAPAGPSRAAPHHVTPANSRTAMQEVDDQVCRRLRLLFRDPVPAIRDDRIFDVIGDTPHHRADHRAECRFATEGQDRHLKLP